MNEIVVNHLKQKNIRDLLMEWYDINKRDLPWRNTNDAYKIWVSEVVLQQTRVAQGLNYYLQFIEKFPTVNVLAACTEEEVLKAWQGLGYYSRARNLYKGAKSVVAIYNSKLPTTYKEIISIEGIGEYTAAAILSIAYNKSYAVVDGNVYRVLSRLFAIDTPIDSSVGKKQFAKLAQNLIDISNPGKYNQAIMELGALQCTPAQPLCHSCSLQHLCAAKQLDMQSEFPVKSKKVKVRNRYFHYFQIEYKDYIFLNKRTNKDIWKNMYEFPLIETEQNISLEDLLVSDSFKLLFGDAEIAICSNAKQFKHILTHQHIYANFYVVKVKQYDVFLSENFIKIQKDDISLYPISRLIHKYLEQK